MLRLVAATLAIVLVAAGAAPGQEVYPNRTIKIVAPFPAGAPVDSVARLFADRLERAWGQPAVVENRGGVAASWERMRSPSRRPMATRCCSPRRRRSRLRPR